MPAEIVFVFFCYRFARSLAGELYTNATRMGGESDVSFWVGRLKCSKVFFYGCGLCANAKGRFSLLSIGGGGPFFVKQQMNEISSNCC